MASQNDLDTVLPEVLSVSSEEMSKRYDFKVTLSEFKLITHNDELDKLFREGQFPFGIEQLQPFMISCNQEPYFRLILSSSKGIQAWVTGYVCQQNGLITHYMAKRLHADSRLSKKVALIFIETLALLGITLNTQLSVRDKPQLQNLILTAPQPPLKSVLKERFECREDFDGLGTEAYVIPLIIRH